MKGMILKLTGLGLLVIGTGAVCLAAPAPEIDPGSGATALTFVGVALMILRSRRRR
jgi:hypothetical protein